MQLIEHLKRSFGANDPDTLYAIRDRAFNSLRRGDYKNDEELLLHIVEASGKYQHNPAIQEAGELAAIDLAGAHFDNGEPDRAEAMLNTILNSLAMGTVTDDDRNRLLILGQIAVVYLTHSRLDDAEMLCRELFMNATQLYGPLNSYRAYCGARLARVLYREGYFDDARQLMAECAEDF